MDEKSRASIEELTRAIEEKKQAELERKALEQERLDIAREQAEREREECEVLGRIIEQVDGLVNVVTNEFIPAVTDQQQKINLILELSKAIVGWMSTQGYREADRLDRLLGDIGSHDMKVDIRADRDVNTGDFIDGDKNIEVSFVEVVRAAGDMIESGDSAGAEHLLASLPEDALDVALAALESPLAAAKLVAEKIAGKIKLVRRG